jgi:hypothetical protein
LGDADGARARRIPRRQGIQESLDARIERQGCRGPAGLQRERAPRHRRPPIEIESEIRE